MSTNYNALAASDGNGEPTRATVQSPGRSIGSTTIPVDATTNWPTGTFIATTGTLLSTGKLDATTVQVFYGTASGTNITITSFAPGYTDKGNAVGDVVVIKPSTEWANIVSQGVQATNQFPANFTNFVETTGGVWSAGTGLVGSSTAGDVWYKGARYSIPAVSSHTFTASKDTYVDVNPATGAYTYVAATNFAAEPAITANCVRVAKVVTGSSTISAVYQLAYQYPVLPNTRPNPYKFSYTGSATSLGSSATAIVVSTTKNFDTSNNVSSGIFTAPIAGFYWFQFTGVIGMSNGANNVGKFFAYKNGSNVREIGAWTTGAITGDSGGAYPFVLSLAAGDTVQPYGLATSGGTGFSSATFEGFLISPI